MDIFERNLHGREFRIRQPASWPLARLTHSPQTQNIFEIEVNCILARAPSAGDSTSTFSIPFRYSNLLDLANFQFCPRHLHWNWESLYELPTHRPLRTAQ